MDEFHKEPMLGVIGGSGLYDIEGLENVKWKEVASPWGSPSDSILLGEIEGNRVAFLPRHGRGHRYSPSGINYRANIDAMKRVGVTDILSLSAVGSLREELDPGTFVIIDQFIDRTFLRDTSFFGNGLVAHVSMAHPVNYRLGDWCEDECKKHNIPVKRGGTYLVMEGPQFSTLAESQLYRKWGCDVIGMTNMPEAKLAREAEIPYCSVAMVTDYDCWHPDHDNVEVDGIIRVLKENADKGRRLVSSILKRMDKRPVICPSGDDRALDSALITDVNNRDMSLIEKLDSVAGRILMSKKK